MLRRLSSISSARAVCARRTRSSARAAAFAGAFAGADGFLETQSQLRESTLELEKRVGFASLMATEGEEVLNDHALIAGFLIEQVWQRSVELARGFCWWRGVFF